MEKQSVNNEIFTKDKTPAENYLLSERDAEDFRNYKRQKKVSEIMMSIARSEGSLLSGADTRRTCERAARLRQAAVKMPLSRLAQARAYLAGSGVRVDCVVGGTGQTLTKVKAYEARVALKNRADEITLLISADALVEGRYGEIRRELKKLSRVVGKKTFKVCVEKELPPVSLSRLAKIASEAHVNYVSVPYFEGCERLRMDLRGGCQLEIFGVHTLQQYRKIAGAGTGRIVTDKIWDIYTEWMKEVEKISFPPKAEPTGQPKPTDEEKSKNEREKQEKQAETTEKTPATPSYGGTIAPTAVKSNPETDYRCCLDGTSLKFL